jgi:hypothetical protein
MHSLHLSIGFLVEGHHRMMRCRTALGAKYNR